MTRRTLVAAGLLLGAAQLAGAQAHPPQPWERRTRPTVSFGADALFSTVNPSNSGVVRDGAGFDVHGGIGVSAFSLAVGYQRTAHDFAGASSQTTYAGPYVEPRVAFDLGGANFTPYLAARVGRLSQKDPATTGTLPNMRRGTLFGAGGGVEVYVARSVALDVGALWSTISFGDDVTLPVPGPAGGRNGALLKAGVRLTR